MHQWARVSPSSVGEHELPTYLLRQAGGRQFLKAIPECLPLVISREEAARGWGRITFFSFWLGGGPKMLSFFLSFCTIWIQEKYKGCVPALEEFIIWLGGGQADAEGPRLWRLEPARSCPLSPRAPAVLSGVQARARPQVSGPQVELLSVLLFYSIGFGHS